MNNIYSKTVTFTIDNSNITGYIHRNRNIHRALSIWRMFSAYSCCGQLTRPRINHTQYFDSYLS